MIRTLVTGDYTSLKPWDRVPSRGTAVRGRTVYEDGKRLGTTHSTPARAAFEYIVEPDGDHLRIHYTPETK